MTPDEEEGQIEEIPAHGPGFFFWLSLQGRDHHLQHQGISDQHEAQRNSRRHAES
jgi:hypothetical protein